MGFAALPGEGERGIYVFDGLWGPGEGKLLIMPLMGFVLRSGKELSWSVEGEGRVCLNVGLPWKNREE
jgi:hypothetical protein